MHTIGIDMSKDSFHAALDDQMVKRFANDAAGIQAFMKSIENFPANDTRIGVEATGVYHLLFATTLDINELGVRHKFKDEITRYNKFRRIALGKSREKETEPEEFDAKSYAIYLLTEGSITEKRQVLGNLRSRLTLNNKVLALKAEAAT